MIIREITALANMDGFGLPSPISGVLFGGEDQAHKFIIRREDGTAFAGTVTAKFLRYADDVTVPLTGSIEDGAATVTLIENCYMRPGRFKLTMYVTESESTTAVYCCMGTVDRTDGQQTIDPSGEINLDVTDLINRIDEAVDSIPPTWTELKDDVDALKSAMDDNGLAQLITAGWINGKRWSTPAPGGTQPGGEYPLAAARYVKIPCVAGDKFVINGTAYAAYRPWAFFDSDNMCLKRADSAGPLVNEVIEAPENTAYLAINQDANRGQCYNGVLTALQIDIAADKATKNAIDGSIAHSNAYDFAANLYDKTTGGTSGYWNGTGYNTTSGQLRITHPIPVQYGVTYEMPFDSSGLGSNQWVAKVDSGNTFISAFTGTVENGKLSFTADFAGYVSANMGTITDDDFFFSPIYKREINPLFGKKLSVDGDSICAGAGYAGGYAKMIGLRNNMIVQNIAVNGATITKGTKFADTDTDRHWISTSIVDMDLDSDYIILEGGVNDDASVIGADKLGTLTGATHFGAQEGNDFVNDFDPTTFCGALEYTFFEAYKRFPGKKIGFIIVHKCAALLNSNGVSASNRYPLIINACNKWGIPFLDLNTECPPLNYIPSLKSTYTNNGDGWHPNEAGYAAYYVPKIETWMKTL